MRGDSGIRLLQQIWDTELRNSMEQSSTWEADNRSAGKENTRVLRNPKIHYCVHKSAPPDANISQLNSDRHNISLPSFQLPLGVPSGLFPSVFLQKFCKYFRNGRAICKVLTWVSRKDWFRFVFWAAIFNMGEELTCNAGSLGDSRKSRGKKLTTWPQNLTSRLKTQRTSTEKSLKGIIGCFVFRMP
jgi:hypothetical protein